MATDLTCLYYSIYKKESGGYDILLIETKQYIQDITPICLPGRNYKDFGQHAIIAGYGKYKRPVCEVDGRGPSKYRYCGVERGCRPGNENYENGHCSIQFRYKVHYEKWILEKLS